MNVLVVDDNSDFSAGLVAMLRTRKGLEVTAHTGHAALDAVRRMAIDLLITDVLMPEVDGLELIREIRRLHPKVPVIAISGGGTTMSANVGLQLSAAFGAGKILIKPFTLSELFEAIAEVVPSFSAQPDC